MKHFKLKPVSSILALALIASAAYCQDETPAEETPAPAPKLNTLKLSFNGLKLNGIRNRPRYTGSPANGLTVEELSYLSPGNEVQPSIRFVVHDIPDRDNWIGGTWVAPAGKTKVEFSTSQRRHNYPGLSPTEVSKDFVAHAGVSTSVGPVGAFASYDDSQRKLNPESPREATKPRTQRISVGLTAPGKTIDGGVTLSQTRFTDGAGLYPTSVQKSANFNVSGDLGAVGSFVGNIGYTEIAQRGFDDSHIRSLGLATSFGLGNRSSLHLDVSRQDLTLPNVLSAYDRQRFSTGAKFNTRISGWTMTFGYRHRESERVRADRSFVDVPSWDSYDIRLAKRLSPYTRMTLRGSWDNLTESATPNTFDTRQLLWDDKAMGQFKIDHANEASAAYFAYTYRFRQNKVRDAEIGWHNFALGFSHQFTEKFDGYSELSYDSFRGSERIEGTNESLATFFPNSMNFGAGINYAYDERTTISAGLNAFSTNNLWGTQITTSYRRQLRDGRSLEFVLAPWSVRDRLLGQSGYNSTLVSLKYSLQF